MMTDRSNRLTVLAAEIVAAHDASCELADQAMERAITAGKLLIEAKASLPHGRWLPWIKENFTFSKRTAQNYIRLAELPEAKAQRLRISELGVRGALRLLGEIDSLPQPKHGEIARTVADHPAHIAWIYRASSAAGLGFEYLVRHGVRPTDAFRDDVDGEPWYCVGTYEQETGILSTVKKPLPGIEWVFETLRMWNFPLDGALWKVTTEPPNAIANYEAMRFKGFDPNGYS